MAITKMSKFTLICVKGKKKSILKDIQSFGNVQFIDLKQSSNEDVKEIFKEEIESSNIKNIEENINKLKSAILYMGPYTEKTSMITSLREGTPEVESSVVDNIINNKEWVEVCDSIRNTELLLNNIENDIKKKQDELELIKPWLSLEVPFDDIKTSKYIKSYMGSIPSKDFEKFENQIKEEFNLVSYNIVSNYKQNTYIIAFSHNEENEKLKQLFKTYDFNEYVSNSNLLPEKIASNLTTEIEELQKTEKIEKEKLYTYDVNILKLAHEYYENELIRLNSVDNFLESKKTTILSGWVPSSCEEELKELLNNTAKDEHVIYFEEVKEEEIDEVPIKLKNNKFFTSFESITEMYSLPKYDGVDPTPLFAPFYCIFFGMMVADFAYGLMVLIAALVALKCFKLGESQSKFAKFFAYLGISTSLWGLVYGSIFGDFIKIPSLITPSEDIFSVLYLSVGFGILQILIGLGIKAWILIKNKKYLDAFYDVGIWLITFAGIALFALKVPGGLYIMIAGMLGIVLTGGRSAASVGGKLASGMYSLYGITNYVGDLISYTRLMALGIAGGSIAGAMNLIIKDLPGISLFVVGPLIFILAHIFNLLLGLLGAYVHACRLQYVEYFSKFYDGGGKKFEPLSMTNRYVIIKNNNNKNQEEK